MKNLNRIFEEVLKSSRLKEYEIDIGELEYNDNRHGGYKPERDTTEWYTKVLEDYLTDLCELFMDKIYDKTTASQREEIWDKATSGVGSSMMGSYFYEA